VKHLNTLLSRAPEVHKADILKELDTDVDYPEIKSWFAYPLTLDWVVDIYFDSSLDTAYKVILDSGSSNLAIATEDCTNCGDASTTLSLTLADPEMCIEVEYGSGSWSGEEVSSTFVGLSSDVSTDVTLAAITDQDDFFEGGASYSGILGMAYEGIANDYYSSLCDSSSSSSSSSRSGESANARAPRLATAAKGASSTSTDTDDAVPLMYALASDSVIDTNAFAVAMCGDYAKVSIGGVDSGMYSGTINYATTQMTFGEYYGYYLIYTTGVRVSDTAVTVTDINKYGGLVVDTGTTLHYLPSATVTAIETAVKSAVSTLDDDFFEWEDCVDSDTLSDFPDITYTFAESDDDDATTFEVKLTAAHYLLEYDSCYYWGFEESTLGIFGNIGMKDKVMVFDITNNQIGIGAGDCSADDDADDDATETQRLFNRKTGMFSEIASQMSKRSNGEVAFGLLSVMAVVGTVMASVFVVAKKISSRNMSEESQSLLPPL